ncbi:hypothetical protein [Iningainema tapete]|nr:hypothetical protein [Iningainema tapete]
MVLVSTIDSEAGRALSIVYFDWQWNVKMAHRVMRSLRDFF